MGLLVFAAIAAQADGDEAPGYQIDQTHAGSQPADGARAPLGIAWSRDLAGAVSYPLIEGGRAYVTVADSGNGTRLFALDLATGAVVWGPVELGGIYNFSAAAYDGGRIFAVNYSGNLQAFDANTGASMWSVQLPGQYSFTTPPTAFQGTVYLSGAGSGGTVYAVNETSGTVTWTAPVMNGDHSSPAVTASGVYVSYACDQAYDFNPTTGALIWHHTSTCEGGGGKTVALYNGRVYTRDFNSGNLILDAQTGAQVGTFPVTVPYGYTIPIPAFSGSMGYFFDSAKLHGVDLGTGNTVWAFAGDGALSSAPIVAGGAVYIGSTSGNLYALDPATGAQLGSINVGAGIAFPDENNAMQLTGLSAGEGYVLAPAGTRVVALTSALSLTPAIVAFSSQAVGTASQSQPVTVTNHTTAAVTLSPISASGDFSSTDNCTSSLAAGASCTVQVTFTPTAAGGRTGTLSVPVSIYATPQTVALSGTGVNPVLDHITVTPAQATVTAGTAQAFRVEGWDSAGNDLGEMTSSASFSIQDSTGTCTGATCTDTVAGTHVVIAVVSGKSATASLNVQPGPANHIIMSPSSATITAGGSQSYTDRASDVYGNDLGDVTQQSVFTLSSPSYASPQACPQATCSTIYATQPGYGDSVQASYTPAGGTALTASSPLTVVPGPIDHLVISPSSDTVTAGYPVGYYVYSADRYGNRIADVNAQLAITAPGTCSGSGCSSTVAGSYVVTATYQGFSVTVSLTVVPDKPTTLVVSPAVATTTAGIGQAYTDRAYDEYGNSFGDETSSSTFTMQNGTCTGNVCISTTTTVPGSYDTVTATWKPSSLFAAISGTAQLAVTPVTVTVDQVTAAAESPNTSIQLSDTVRVSARVTPGSMCCGPADGTVTFAIGGTSIAVPVHFAAGATSATVTADYPLSAAAVPSGAGVYTLNAGYHSSSVNYADATGTASVTVLRETASVTFNGPYYVSDGTTPSLAVTVDQRDPTSDTHFIDYSVTPVWVRFDVFAPGAAFPTQTRYAQVRNASNWSTTGLGTARVTLSTPLADGVHEVVAGIVAGSTSPAGNSSTYLASDALRVYLASAPSSPTFAAGAGFITPDSTSNTGSRNGYFGFSLKPGKPPTGSVAYTYRISMDVGGGQIRDVDVEVTSTSVGSLSLNSGGSGGSVSASGKCAVRYLDAITGADYTSFDFTGGSYQLSATDGGSSGSKYRLVLKRPDGSAFHSSSSTQVLISGGAISVRTDN